MESITDELREWMKGSTLSSWTAEHLTAIADLKAENARLRSCLSDDAENARMIMAENAKLRELVRDMFYAVHPVDREKFLTNVAELGVEVEP